MGLLAAGGGEEAPAAEAARAAAPVAVPRTVVAVPGDGLRGAAPVGVPHAEADDGGPVLPMLPSLAAVATDVQQPPVAPGSPTTNGFDGGRPTPSPVGSSPTPAGDAAVRMPKRDEPTIVAAMNEEKTSPWGSPGGVGGGPPPGGTAAAAAAAAASSSAGVHKKVNVYRAPSNADWMVPSSSTRSSRRAAPTACRRLLLTASMLARTLPRQAREVLVGAHRLASPPASQLTLRA